MKLEWNVSNRLEGMRNMKKSLSTVLGTQPIIGIVVSLGIFVWVQTIV